MNRPKIFIAGCRLILLITCIGSANSISAQTGRSNYDALVVKLRWEIDEIQAKGSGDVESQSELTQLKQILQKFEPEFPLPRGRSIATVEAYRRYGLTRYYMADVSKMSVAEAEALLRKIQRNSLVEEAMLKAPLVEIEDAGVPIRQRTRVVPPNYTREQYYLFAPNALAAGYAIGGVNAEEAWRYPGGDGSHARIVSLEAYHWDYEHIDLPQPFVKHWNINNHQVGEHDTKSVGVMASKNNGFGTTGIAYGAQIGYSKSAGSRDLGRQLLDLGSHLRSGDVIQIGVQAQDDALDSAINCKPNCLIPVDYYSDNVAAIKFLTREFGINVVEAGANGNINLDDSAFNGKFNRVLNDSGAIIVGAADPKLGTRASFSDYGSRVDVYSWGRYVTTTTLDPENPHQGYTRTYSGTSSANPIVAATAAVLQSVARAEGIGDLPPDVVRRVLTETGTPLPKGNSLIGTQPDLKSAIDRILTDYAGTPPPEAKITGPATVEVNGKLTLSGMNSAGHDLSYVWSASEFAPASSIEPTVELTAPATAGSHDVSLTVRDRVGRAHTVTQAISVSAIAGPIAATLTAPESVKSGDLVPVHVDAKSSTNRPLSYSWSRTSALFEGSIGNSPSGNYTAAAVTQPTKGSILVTVSDDRGNTYRTPSRIVSVEPVGVPEPGQPSVSLGTPQVSGPAPATVTLTADASVSGATISKVEFFNGATRLGEKTTAPYTYSWPNVAAGNYSVTAKATSSQNGSVTSAAVAVTVSQGLPPAPVAKITGPTSVSIGQTLELVGSDSSGEGLSYVWQALGLSPSSSTTANPSFSVPESAAGTRTITLTVTDAHNRNANASHVVTVTAPPVGETCDYRDPAATGVPAWEFKGYNAGERVSHQNVVWQARYNTGIAAPDVNDAWALVSNVPVPYNSARAYDGGTLVTYQGVIYEADWWIKDTTPPASPWTRIGPCQ